MSCAQRAARRQSLHLDESILNSLAAATYTADAIRRHGAIPSLELSHSGMFAGTYMTDKTKQKTMHQWGPSATVRADGVEVRELTKDMIDEIVASYGHVAGLAKRAGFEMLMIHGGHGWLINQFLSPMFNHRTDKQIEPYVDIIHVSAGTYQRTFGNTHPSMFTEHGCNVHLAAEIKKHVSKPVSTIGGLNDPAQMEEIIASGKADIVYMARALLADPELPRKVVENRDEEIVRCLRCFTCMAERAATSTRRCTVNPLIGREMDGIEVVPVKESDRKKVLVAGAGPGGLYAAYTAARRGHEVILCEKESEVGGILKSEQAMPFKHEMYELSGTYKLLAEKAGVEIRLNTEVTPEYVEKENPYALIIAAGSTPLVPPIPGLRGDNVVVVNNYYKEKEKVTDDVVVFGGGLAGCECAIHLGMDGKRVHLVEMRDQLAPDANVRHRPLLLKEIDKYVTVHTGYKGLEVTSEGIWCENAEGERVLVPGTSVICALGQRSRTDVVEALMNTAPYVRVIGDASRVSTITNAVYWGHHAALDI